MHVLTLPRKGNSLPPFPEPTHGPSGSGLKPYVSIGAALEFLERLGERAGRDEYHTLHEQIPPEKWLYDPYTKFVDCILTSGPKCRHWNGEKFSPRELAILQSLPYFHRLSGTRRQAIKQIGNMFPPVMAELIYRTCAQTLEAFDHGFISADEDIDDLNVTLIEKGVDIPELSSTSASVFDLTGSLSKSPYRYLSRPTLSDATHVDHSSAFQRRTLEEADRIVGDRMKRPFDSRVSDNESVDDASSPTTQRLKRAMSSAKEKRFWDGFNGDIVEISDSED